MVYFICFICVNLVPVLFLKIEGFRKYGTKSVAH